MAKPGSSRQARRTAVMPRKKNKTAKKKNKEMTMIGGLLRGLGGLGGGAIGSYAGNSAMGTSLGTAAGGQLSKWLGYGDYSVTRNSLIAKGSDSIPSMHNSGQSIIVRHKEFVGDVYSATGVPSVFGVHAEYVLNPGLSGSFPWLSTVAQNFVEYTWRGIVYHYVPTSGMSVASTNTGLGSVMMATNYRATAPSYTNKQTMLNEFFASDARPSEPFIHPIECDPKENPYNVQYVRVGDVPDGEDQKTYDLGVTTVATVGTPAAGINLGEIWVSYEVELRKPKALGTYQLDALFYAEDRTTYASTTATFGTTAGTTTYGSGVLTAPTTLTFDKELVGKYLIEIQYLATAITASAAWVPTVTGGTRIDYNGLATTGMSSTTGYVTHRGIFESTNPSIPMVITCTTTVITGTCGTIKIRISELNSLAPLIF